MTYTSRTARRYARALYSLAAEQALTDRVTADLRLVAETAEKHPELLAFLGHERIPHDRKTAVLAAVFRPEADPAATTGDDPSVPADEPVELSFHFLDLLLRKGRITLLREIVAAMEEMLDKDRGVVHATATTAVPLLKAERDRLTEVLTQMTGAQTIELQTRVRKSIVGGLVVHVGDSVIDASVATYLGTMRERLRRVRVSDFASGNLLAIDFAGLRETPGNGDPSGTNDRAE